MIGKQINNLVNTIKAVGSKFVPMTNDMVLIDDAHVMMMLVKSTDRSPVFGIVSDNILDIKNIPKLPDNEEFDVEESNCKYILYNNESRYSISYDLDAEAMNPRIPELDLPISVDVSAKTVQNALKTLKGISDYVTIQSDRKHLTMTAKGGQDGGFQGPR